MKLPTVDGLQAFIKCNFVCFNLILSLQEALEAPSPGGIITPNLWNNMNSAKQHLRAANHINTVSSKLKVYRKLLFDLHPPKVAEETGLPLTK